MRRSLLVLLAIAVFPSTAVAAPVLVLGRDGRVVHRNDPYLVGPAVTPVPASGSGSGSTPTSRVGAAIARAARTTASGSGSGGTGLPTGGSSGGSGSASHHRSGGKGSKKKPRPQKTVLSELLRLSRAGAILPPTYRSDVASFKAALASERRLKGTRRAELTAVTQTMHQIAASGQLTSSRVPALFATLNANRRWWTTGPLLSYGQRVEFAGSELVWEYYPGQGIQLQVLGSFGKADGLFTAGRSKYAQMTQLLAELIPLASNRGGGLTWEYYFSFDGGSPPWTSAMSQATGLEALTRAYEATHNAYYLQVAAHALPIFSKPPPVGVAVKTAVGTRFLQYTFSSSRSDEIINAFLQTLIGLYDYAHVSGDRTAQALFAAGNAEAIAELPSYDTGAWSLYQPGVEDTLSYHDLVTGFVSQLCARTNDHVYCTTAQHFRAYLKTPPVLTQLTTSVHRRHPFALRFRLSKYSHVGIVVSQGSRTVLATSADLPYGIRAFAVPGLRRMGSYTVVLTATDLAGNYARVSGTLTVTR